MVGAMCEVQSEDVDAGQDEISKPLASLAGGPDSRDDLRFDVGPIEVATWLDWHAISTDISQMDSNSTLVNAVDAETTPIGVG